MLSLSNVGAKQAGSYYQKDGYYARLNDRDDVWFGKIKGELELPDQVMKEDFDFLIMDHKERAGFDLCFSAPKSVSVAMVLSDSTRADMIEAHHIAVEKMLREIESREIGTRITNHKLTKHIKTGNMLCGRFTHYVSRAQDPQLHTHCVILNKTVYNGKIYAIDNPSLYKNKMLYGQLYRNTLAKELMKRGYGIHVTDQEKGFFELSGISKETLERFSTRRIEIEKKLKEWGASGRVASEQATLITRNAKEKKDINLLMEAWRETIHEVGGADLVKWPKPVLPDKDQIEMAFEKAISRMTRKEFAFTEKQFKRLALAYGVGAGMTEEQYGDLFQKVIGDKIKRLGHRSDSSDNQVYYCTAENLKMEAEIFAEVSKSRNSLEAISRHDAMNALVKLALDSEGRWMVSNQQRDAILFLATTKDQFCTIQGLAGTGKTYMLNYGRRVLEEHGYVVKGACFTGKAANGLQQGAQIPSMTLHSFLNSLEKEAGHMDLNQDFKNKPVWNFKGLLPCQTKEVWIIDEASMIDNVVMRHLIEAAKLKKAKVCLVGDRQQLLPVGVGNAFSNMVDHKKVACYTLDEIRRQKNKELLASVKEAVTGDILKSFEILDQKKAFVTIEHRKERLNAIVTEFVSLPKDSREATVILTATNKDRRELNRSVRNQLKAQGELQNGFPFSVKNTEGAVYQREFAPGDKLIFLQNDNKSGIRNGQTGFLERIEGDTFTVRFGDKAKPEYLNINIQEYAFVEHGYAMTSHKAQGITEDRALIHLDSYHKSLNSRNSFYVDISRARFDVKIFTDDQEAIQRQVKNFAKKITSDDFAVTLQPLKKIQGKILSKDEVKQFCETMIDKIHTSANDFRSHFIVHDLAPFQKARELLNSFKEPDINQTKQPTVSKGPDRMLK